jgi:hypothetical protein
LSTYHRPLAISVPERRQNIEVCHKFGLRGSLQQSHKAIDRDIRDEELHAKRRRISIGLASPIESDQLAGARGHRGVISSPHRQAQG